MFTKRELEIMALIAKGFTTVMIAERLELSHGTIKSHRGNMISKIRDTGDEKTSLLAFSIEYIHQVQNSTVKNEIR